MLPIQFGLLSRDPVGRPVVSAADHKPPPTDRYMILKPNILLLPGGVWFKLWNPNTGKVKAPGCRNLSGLCVFYKIKRTKLQFIELRIVVTRWVYSLNCSPKRCITVQKYVFDPPMKIFILFFGHLVPI